MPSPPEERIIARGTRLFEAMGQEKPSVFDKSFWTGKVLDWAMGNEDFKVRLLRFVDVLPYLTTPDSLQRHLEEYFLGDGCDIPPVLKWGAEQAGRWGGLASRALGKAIHANIQAMARQFIVGSNAGEAVSHLGKLRRQGFAFTVAHLGEATLSEQEADLYQAHYLELLSALALAQEKWPPLGGPGPGDWGFAPRIDLSIKPSAFYSQAKPAALEKSVEGILGRLIPIYRRVIDLGGSLCLDMEQHRFKDITLELFRRLRACPEFSHYPHLTLVVQAYLRRSEEDLEDLLAWSRAESLPISLRLVKGAYWEYEYATALQNGWEPPVWSIKAESDLAFERLASRILANHDLCYLACASHNLRSIAAVMEMAQTLGAPPERYEFQVLYGMAEPVRKALLGQAGRVRLYCPYGELIPGMAYLVRRLLENTSNESFLRQSFVEGAAREHLLQSPASALGQERERRLRIVGAPDDAAEEPPHFANHTLADFSRPADRAAMAAALGMVRSRLARRYPLYIDGREVFTGNALASHNPADPAEIIGEACLAGPPEMEQAVAAAARAFPAWREASARERVGCLLKAAAAARRRLPELSAWQILEVGKQWDQAWADVAEAVDFLEYYAREMLRLAPPRRMGRKPGEHNLLSYQPRGVCAVIAPWNFPLAISTGMAAAALVTGNCVVYKPASLSPVVGWGLVELLREAGLPPGVFNYCPGRGQEVGDLLVEHPLVSLIAFTGSIEVGLRIQQKAAHPHPEQRHAKRVIAEMGGKNAVIIDDDADLDEAVPQVLASAFGFQGQKCSACSRVIVLDAVYERFRARLLEAAQSLAIGPAEDPANYMGPVVDAAQRDKVLAYAEIAAQEGRILLRREGPNQGYYAPMVIVEGIEPRHRLAQEEVFGPVLALMRATGFDHALELANSTRQALTGGVFSRSPRHLEQARQQFRVGNLYLNRQITGALVERQPFGGFNLSGVGFKAGGPDYLLQFMDARCVTENTIRRGFTPIAQDDEW